MPILLPLFEVKGGFHDSRNCGQLRGDVAAFRKSSGSLLPLIQLNHSLAISTSKPTNLGPLELSGCSFYFVQMGNPYLPLFDFCRCISLCPPSFLPAPDSHSFGTCLCFQPWGQEQGTASGTRPSALLVLSFIIWGLVKGRPYSQLKRGLIWDQGWKRPLGAGPDHLMLTSPGQGPISWDRDPLTSC